MTHTYLILFFVKDQINKKELKIKNCPTGNMLADYFTKPLQGGLFHCFRNVIMGYESIDSLFKVGQDIENKERVGDTNISNSKADQVFSSPSCP